MTTIILTAIGGVIFIFGFIWFFRRNWKDLRDVLDDIGHADEKEKAD